MPRKIAAMPLHERVNEYNRMVSKLTGAKFERTKSWWEQAYEGLLQEAQNASGEEEHKAVKARFHLLAEVRDAALKKDYRRMRTGMVKLYGKDILDGKGFKAPPKVEPK